MRMRTILLVLVGIIVGGMPLEVRAETPQLYEVFGTYKSLPLRERPSKDSPTIEQLPNGTVVFVVETTGNWAKVRFQKVPPLEVEEIVVSVEGYVIRSWIRPASNQNMMASSLNSFRNVLKSVTARCEKSKAEFRDHFTGKIEKTWISWEHPTTSGNQQIIAGVNYMKIQYSDIFSGLDKMIDLIGSMASPVCEKALRVARKRAAAQCLQNGKAVDTEWITTIGMADCHGDDGVEAE